MYVGNNYGSLTVADRDNKVIVMTYHSAKGLDFDYVYLPMANDGMFIHSNIDSLLLVALSRSKAGLFISYTGSIYPDLNKFLSGIQRKKILSNDNTEIVF
jgi:superfamily I DNA/RNA helicase